MRWNDDIVNQRILGVEQTAKGFILSLTNGMDIYVPKKFSKVDDAGVNYPLDKWVTYEDGARTRSPMSKPESMKVKECERYLAEVQG